MKDKILHWFANGRVGLSSKAMACAIAGIPSDNNFHPHDPDDFNRCLLFLEAVPEARNHLCEVAKLSIEWKYIVDNWDKIEKQFWDDKFNYWDKRLRSDKSYKLMDEILNQARNERVVNKNEH